MKISSAIFLVLGLLAGLAIGYKAFHIDSTKLTSEAREQGEQAAKESYDLELNEFKSPFQKLSPEEIREYLRTQNADEKLRKADELLAKMMQIFVAQVGLKLTQADLNQFGKVPSKAETAAPIDNQPPPKIETPPAVAKNQDVEDRLLAQRLKSRTRNVNSAAEADRFAKMLGDNYAERVQDSQILTREQIRNLNGIFEGEIKFDKDKTVQRVNLEFNGRVEKNRFIEGTLSLKIFDENNKLINQTTGSGNVSKNLSGNENEIFVEAGRYFLQLTFFPAMDSWGGVYLENEKGRFNRLGSVILRRR